MGKADVKVILRRPFYKLSETRLFFYDLVGKDFVVWSGL